MNRVVSKGTKIKLGVFSMVLALTLVPVVSGYGSTQGSAETIDESMEYYIGEEWWMGDYVAWYQVLCYQENDVSMNLYLDYSENMSVTVYDPDSYAVAYDSGAYDAYYNIYIPCDQAGYYTIELYRYSPSSDNYIRIYIEGVEGPHDIPGYSTLVILVLGIGVTLAIAFRLLKKRKI